ncbi:hypothetical protein ACFO3O_21340 [Dokdonia ponticola]|uniref:Uncharacterized protein n=1 Tax=Dokdonia ponticola TaxID=2041041 RepID=A0ABV9I2W4_9FLAO
MLDTLSRNIIYGNTYCSLEHTGTDTHGKIIILICKQQKGELKLISKESVSSIEGVKEFQPKLRYAHLVINNNQVLQKTIETINTLSDTVLLNQTFPNIDLEAFYHEIIRSKEKAYVYICRKSYIDSLHKEYESQSIFITHWSLGSTPLVSLLPFLKRESQIQSPTTTLKLKEGEITSIDRMASENYPNETYDVTGLQIDGEYINGLGSIIKTIAGVDEKYVSNNFETKEKEQQSYFKQHRLFTIGLPLAIGVLFTIFLVNFLFYSYYYDEVAVLQEIGSTNTLQKKLLVKKDSIVDQKQKLFEDVIASASSSASYCIDEIIQEMPETILLEGLQYHPLQKKIRKNKIVEIEENTIVITGETSENADLSSWISSLENLEFTDSVSIDNLEEKGKNIRFSIALLIKA